MNRETWKPKVGDRVRITGHGGHTSVRLVTFLADLETVSSVTPDGFVGVRSDTVFVHSRLCDPVLEDERKGAPRPPIQDKELLNLTLLVPCHIAANDRLRMWQEDVLAESRALEGGNATISVAHPRVRQIERRGPNLGREARKS